jgi:AcrR family transcriptional regulator
VTLFHEAAPRRQGRPETRRRIAEAAAARFVERGYAGTTLEAVATAAGVHVQRIYQIYGSKPALLEAATRVVVAGPDDFEGLGREWAWVRELHAEPEPRRVLGRFAAHVRELAGRAGPLTAEIRSAARSDPEVARFLAMLQESRARGPAGVVRRLTELGALRRGLDVDDAVATLLAVSGYDSYDTLVRDRSWSEDAYEHWLTELFCRLLLDDPAPASD